MRAPPRASVESRVGIRSETFEQSPHPVGRNQIASVSKVDGGRSSMVRSSTFPWRADLR